MEEKEEIDEKKRKFDNEEDDDDQEDDENKKIKFDLGEVDELEALEWLKNLDTKDIIDEKFFNEKFVDESNKNFRGAKPFPFLFIENLFKEDVFAEKLLEEISQEKMFTRSNDLFDFFQTDDFKKCKRPLINKMRDILYGEEFRKSLEKITGIELYKYTEEVSMSAAVYQQGHKLLCHDDQLEGRRLAYVIYLVDKEWKESDGGTLDLFESEDWHM